MVWPEKRLPRLKPDETVQETDLRFSREVDSVFLGDWWAMNSIIKRCPHTKAMSKKTYDAILGKTHAPFVRVDDQPELR